jgi:hypothetical protein
MFFKNLAMDNAHVIEEVLPKCADCQSKLVLLIGGGGAICENACHFDNVRHLSHIRNLSSKAISFLVELMECFDRGRAKRATAYVDFHEPGDLHPPLKKTFVKLRKPRSDSGSTWDFSKNIKFKCSTSKA